MRELFSQVSKQEWRVLTLVIIGLIVVTALPYLYGYWQRPAGMVYTGLHRLTPVDNNVWYSMIEQTKQGHTVFLNLYTAEAQLRLFVNPLWLSVGLMAKIFSLSNVLAVQLARTIWVAIFCLVAYLLLVYFITDYKRRIWFLLIILLSSGLGIFLNPFLFNLNNLYEHPTDIWVPESITFLTLYHAPHQIASLTLILLVFLLMLLAFDTGKYRYSLAAGVAAFFMLWFHPFNGPTIYLVLAVFLALQFYWKEKINWLKVKQYLVLCLVPIPAVLYLFLISRADWVIREWSAQNILPSPSPWMYLIGYGLLVPFALIGFYRIIKKPYSKGLFLIAWLVTAAALLYSPVDFQRRMSEGLHLPVSILAGLGIFYLIDRWRLNPPGFYIKAATLTIFLIIFLPLTNVQIVADDFRLYSLPLADQLERPFYLYQEEVDAMHWLRDNIKEDEVIFSSYYTGNFIPAYSGRIVWIGHGPQTINLSLKKEISAWFWRDSQELEVKYQLLKKDGIDYVYYGRKEKELGGLDPGQYDFFQEVFSNSRVVIYRVL